MHCIIACPSKMARLHHQTVVTIARIQKWLRTDGHSCGLYLKPFAELVEGRNFVATRTFNSDADILIGLDDDIGVSREAFDRMLGADADLIGARVPSRLMDFERFAQGVQQGMSDEEAERFAASADGEEMGRRTGSATSSGSAAGSSWSAGASSRRSSRRVWRSARSGRSPQGEVDTLGFYDHMKDENGVQMSADDSFCRRVREAGFGIKAYSGQGVSFTSGSGFRNMSARKGLAIRPEMAAIASASGRRARGD